MKPPRHQGFTIVELLIVIVVIAILATISVVAYNGIQDRAKNAQVQSDINQIQKKIELYYAENGAYPSTGGFNTSNVYVDSNCQIFTTNPHRTDWVPGIDGEPQNPGLEDMGVRDQGGCYMYASDGVTYILSAWNARRGAPAKDGMYRRFGFREANFNDQRYICNHAFIGGVSGGSYSADIDYYKRSYTVGNVSCNETPPSGA